MLLPFRRGTQQSRIISEVSDKLLVLIGDPRDTKLRVTMGWNLTRTLTSPRTHQAATLQSLPINNVLSSHRKTDRIGHKGKKSEISSLQYFRDRRNISSWMTIILFVMSRVTGSNGMTCSYRPLVNPAASAVSLMSRREMTPITWTERRCSKKSDNPSKQVMTNNKQQVGTNCDVKVSMWTKLD